MLEDQNVIHIQLCGSSGLQSKFMPVLLSISKLSDDENPGAPTAYPGPGPGHTHITSSSLHRRNLPPAEI